MLELAERHQVKIPTEPCIKTAIISSQAFLSLHARLKSEALRANLDVTSFYGLRDMFDPAATVERPLRPAAEQAEGMTVADDGSITFTRGRLEVSLRPMTAEELGRQFPDAPHGTFQDLIVFRLAAKNYEYPKVTFDPNGFALQSADGRAWRSHSASLNYSRPIPVSSVMATMGLFAGQEASGRLTFKELDADVRDIQITVKNVVVRFSCLGEPVETLDFSYRFVR